MANFSGEYQVECIANHDAAMVGLTDKPCWKISNDDGFVGFVWGDFRDPHTAAIKFFKELGFRFPMLKPVPRFTLENGTIE